MPTKLRAKTTIDAPTSVLALKRLARLLDTSAEIWLGLQNDWDLAVGMIAGPGQSGRHPGPHQTGARRHARRPRGRRLRVHRNPVRRGPMARATRAVCGRLGGMVHR